jgi:hypothetical protein
MKKIMLAFLSLALLAGCAPKMFVHDTKNSQDFERDKYDCEQIATQLVANRGYSTTSFGTNPLMIRDETIKCLKFKYGWKEQSHN